MEKLPLNKRIAETAHIGLENADRAIDATLAAFRCLGHIEAINVGNTPVPHVNVGNTPVPHVNVANTPVPHAVETNSSSASLEQFRKKCQPTRRGDLLAYIAKEAGIDQRAAGIALALVLDLLNAIGREAGVRSVPEPLP